jgi:hypothetical protein
MAESASFRTLKEQYFLLDRNFNKLFSACPDAERDHLRRDYVNARDNFWEARNRIFQENDPLVEQLNRELTTVQGEIKKELKKLTNIVAVLGLITRAVRLGSSLVTLGSMTA